MQPRSSVVSLGVFLVVLAVYGIVGPGRIDIIDGQYRFEVAHSLATVGSVEVSDPMLGDAVQGIDAVYSPYGVSGSIVPLPLVLAARLFGPPSIDRQQFFFSFGSAVLSAGTAAILFLFYRALDVPPRPALFWTFVSAFTTLAFPAAASVFDQAQHAFFVIAACFLAFAAARRHSMALAMAGGASLAILVNFQETYALFIPTLALATLARPGAAPDERRRSIERAIIFVVVASLGLIFWASMNYFRFGSVLFSGKGVNHPSPFGNPLVGLTGLLFSPGKSIFLYSPPTLLALFGIAHLLRRERPLGIAIVTGCVAEIALISVLSFWGGDWCWGPRYFVPILPLLALAFPMAAFPTVSSRLAMRTIIAVGLVVQLLALSVDHHRFFYARSLARFFWYTDRAFYFRQSALFSRPAELLTSISDGVPPEAEAFRPGPYQHLLTYAVFGGWGHRDLAPPEWMRHYRVFWLPRPWPLWMRSIPLADRPIDVNAAVVALLMMAAAGAATIRYGLGTRPLADAPQVA